MKSLFTLVLPLIVAIGGMFAYAQGGETRDFWVSSQTSMLEAVTGLALFVTFCVCVVTLFMPAIKNKKYDFRWVLAFTFCVFYFMGEDQNWGQYYLNLAVPEYFLAHNKEQELNLHNMSSWFNQKPRFVMDMWILFAGIIVPLGWSKPKQWLARWLPEKFWPDKRLVALGVFTLLTPMIERVYYHTGWVISESLFNFRYSELQEFCYANYMFLYIMMIRDRAKQQFAA